MRVLESLRGCLRVVLPQYTVGWEKEKKSQKKTVFFLLIDFFQQILNKHLLCTRNYAQCWGYNNKQGTSPTLQGNALVFFKWAGVGNVTKW